MDPEGGIPYPLYAGIIKNRIMKKTGKLDWAFSAGRIPFQSTGKEPEFISHDKIAVLNTSEEEALIELFILYENVKPVGPIQ
jgi:hypothetical protein